MWTVSFKEQTYNYFQSVAEHALGNLQSGEELSISLHAEDSDFLRFNKSLIRQSTHVKQYNFDILAQFNKRRMNLNISGTGNIEMDQQRLAQTLAQVRQELKCLPEDPAAADFKNHGKSKQDFAGKLVANEDLPKILESTAKDLDLAGLYAGGDIIKANANSAGQNHWFSTRNFFFDYSLYTVNESQENKAVKNLYSGLNWSSDQFAHSLNNDRVKIDLLKKKTISVKPGEYRVYFAPGAVSELLGMLNWGAMSYTAIRQGSSAFRKFAAGEVKLSPHITVKENFKLGLCPQFNSLGEVAPEELVLIEKGLSKNWMVSSKSAQEYNVPSNAADNGYFSSEGLRSADLVAGDLDPAQALQKLGTGLYISNLHYLNWSDLQSARVTGMTRYACFWVQDGEIQGPIKDLRFDDSFYNFWGESRLEALTQHSEVETAVETYERRSLGGRRSPGMLVSGFKFTL